MNTLHIPSIKFPDAQAFVESLRPQVEERIRQLRMLHEGIAPMPVGQDILQTILSKLSAVRNGEDVSLSLYEKQCLCFHIAEDICAPLRDFFLSQYIGSHWEKECAKGLLHTLLQYWNMEHIVQPIWRILNDHYQELSQSQREAYRYMDNAGAARKLGTFLLRNRKNVICATDYVLLERSMFLYRYFEDVMESWFLNRFLSIADLAVLRTAIERHNKLSFNQTLLPSVIIYADKQSGFDDNRKRELISISQQAIGNIDKQVLWQSSTLDEKQRGNLLVARNILRKWMIERVIDTVFTKAGTIAHPDRAAFWRQYAKTLLEMNKDSQRTFIRVLSKDPTIRANVPYSDYVDVQKLSHGPSNTALVMRFGAYSIVELLGGGTMYIYHQQSSFNTSSDMYWRVFNLISSISDLISDVPEIFRDQVTNTGIAHKPSSCRMAHRGKDTHWQSSFTTLLAQRGIFKQK